MSLYFFFCTMDRSFISLKTVAHYLLVLKQQHRILFFVNESFVEYSVKLSLGPSECWPKRARTAALHRLEHVFGAARFDKYSRSVNVVYHLVEITTLHEDRIPSLLQ